MARHARGSIDRAAVLEAALSLADRVGLEGVTVRALAAELGRAPMTLYAHFSKKERLYDLMFEEVVRRLFPPAELGGWREELESGCRRARAILLQHPNWIPLLTRVTVPPVTLALYDGLLARMAEDGHSAEEVMLAVSAALSFTIGLVLVERMMSAHRSEPVPVQQLRLVTELIPHLPEHLYPALRTVGTSFERFSFDTVFDAGIRALAAGIERAPSPNGGAALRKVG